MKTKAQLREEVDFLKCQVKKAQIENGELLDRQDLLIESTVVKFTVWLWLHCKRKNGNLKCWQYEESSNLLSTKEAYKFYELDQLLK